MNKYAIDQKGRSMIEMLGVLAIVGVLSVAGIAGYSKAMGKYKISKVMDQVATLSASIKTQFAAMGTYAPLSGNARAYNLGLFPDDMTKACTADTAATCERNGVNGNVSVIHTDENDAFAIQFTGLSKEACVAVFTSDWGGSAGFKYVTTGIDADGLASVTTAAPSDDKTYTAETLASTGASAATSACESEDANIVTWVFY